MKKLRLILPLILFSLLAAIGSGWVRMGWPLPLGHLAPFHGAIMVNSFLASLIFLERAVTFRSKWVLLLPFINAISIIGFCFNQPLIAHLFLVAGSTGFLLMCCYFIYYYKELYYYVFLAGAFCLCAGNIILAITNNYQTTVSWWIGFLLFTIVAERLELSKFLPLTKAKKTLLLICLGSVLISISIMQRLPGMIVFASGLSATAAWLVRFDMARHSIKTKGAHRYSGSLLLVGFLWLFLTGIFILIQQRIPFGYDALLHSFFIGFVFSMIFSHAPIILPAISKLPIKIYRPILYVWFYLLQLSLLIRIGADVMGNVILRKWGGMINGITILLFFITIALITIMEVRKRNLRKP